MKKKFGEVRNHSQRFMGRAWFPRWLTPNFILDQAPGLEENSPQKCPRARRDKGEARNPKFETNSNDQNLKFQTNPILLEVLNFSKFGVIWLPSDFDIRISDFL
jgi:hypothetical protein